MTKAKPKRRLKNLVIGELSLVDRGAVPESDFVVLSKRVDIEPEPDVTTETPESEIVALAKAMDSDTAYEAANALHLMAEMTQLGVALKRCKDRMSPEMKKAFDDLKSAMHDEPVEKNEPEVTVETPAEPVIEQPIKKRADDEFADALSLIKKHRQAEADQQDEQIVKSALNSLNTLAAELKGTQQELANIKSEIAHAKGQE